MYNVYAICVMHSHNYIFIIHSLIHLEKLITNCLYLDIMI